LIPGSGIGFFRIPDLGSRTPNPYSRGPGENFLGKNLNHSWKIAVWRIRDADFYPSRIPDPKTTTKEVGEKKFDVIPFLVATDFTKLYIFLVLKC